MLNVLRNQLLKVIDDIDAGNSNLSAEDEFKILRVLGNIGRLVEYSKTDAAAYIGVSRATFDNYVRNGWIPRGEKYEGFKELRWYLSDLDKFLEELHNN